MLQTRPSAPSPPQPPTPRPGGAGARPSASIPEVARRAIDEAREDIASEIADAKEERDEAVEELRELRTAGREALSPGAHIRRVRAQEQVVAQLDQRIVQLEWASTALGSTRAGEAATAGTLVPAQPPGGPFPIPFDAISNIVIVFTIVFFGPISIAVARLIWKRASVPRVAPAALETREQLDRLSHAVDAIAVEVERISEGQRFVTKLLAEPPNAGALGVAPRVDANAPQRDPVKVPSER